MQKTTAAQRSPAEIFGKTAQADEIVAKHACMALWLGLQPVPVLDFIAITWLQLKMTKKLADLHGIPFSKNKAKNIIPSLIGGGFSASAGWRILFSIAKLFPNPGVSLTGAAGSGIAAGAATYAVGKVFSRHFAEGGTFLSFDPKEARAFYQQMFKEGQSVAADLKQGGRSLPATAAEPAVPEKAPEASASNAETVQAAAASAEPVSQDEASAAFNEHAAGVAAAPESPLPEETEANPSELAVSSAETAAEPVQPEHPAEPAEIAPAAEPTEQVQPEEAAKEDDAHAKAASEQAAADKKAEKPVGGIEIVDILFQGKMKGEQADEHVEIRNNSTEPADLSGWQVMPFRGRKIFTFPAGTILEPGKSFRVYTNEIHPESGGFSFGSNRAVWRDVGGIGILRNAARQEVCRFAYGDKKQQPLPGQHAGGGI